ncbi:hypothetical protein C8R44DRAFT_725240 [Mycena epipterygia]|nr:hypothetical protein C8R44DRAFT_725240 [Mycena epipterygia]
MHKIFRGMLADTLPSDYVFVKRFIVKRLASLRVSLRFSRPASSSSIPLKNRATAAINGNLEALRALYARSAHSRDNFLPVYHIGLDASIVSTFSARLHSASDSNPSSEFDFFETKLSHMFLCLKGILRLHASGLVPLASFPDLWSQLCPFIRFIDTYRDSLPDVEVLRDSKLLYEQFLAALCMLREHKATEELITGTPRLHVVLFRMWAVFLQEPSNVGGKEFLDLCTYMQDWPDLSDDRGFDEALEATGGTRTALASLFVRHVNCLVNDPRPSLAHLSLQFSFPILVPSMHSRAMVDDDFRQALIDHGVIEALTGAAVECCLSPVLSVEPLLFDNCVVHTYQYLLAPCGHNLIIRCLRAGFLKWFFGWTKGNFLSDRTPSDHSMQVLWLLSTSLVYSPVLAQLQASINELAFPVNADSLKGFLISDKWQTFWSVFERRRKLMQSYLSRDLENAPSMAACDNVKCGAIGRKSDFRRCSDCLTFNYCSQACQVLDWRSGGHRTACKSMLQLRLDDTTNATARDRSFFRALLHDDYLRLKTQILTSEVQFLRSTPGADRYVMFNYRAGGFVACDVSVRDMGELLNYCPRWSDYVRRAAESEGRMRIHVMEVVGDGGSSSWMFPLRSSTSDIMAEVVKIATEVGVENSEVDTLCIQRLVDLDVIEMHN